MVGLFEVEAADDQNADIGTKACRTSLPGGRHIGVLSRIMDTPCDNILRPLTGRVPGAASFTIYSGTKEYFRVHKYFERDNVLNVAASGAIGGALAGATITFGSIPFELVKVRRQLEYSIAEGKGVHLVKPPGTMEAVREIFKTKGIAGLYTGGRLHFGALSQCYDIGPHR
ncbi:hypothetical protein HWV62_15184 [Athelia sp. TMB]|nr:hypothetical protein HWV62_35127 [Athelia sp. TMB]KAF7973398.1 hypothetical protein HWV62_15184 [Athelia sp. TMB]